MVIAQREEKAEEKLPVWVVPGWNEVTDLIHLSAYTVRTASYPTNLRLACGGMMSAAGWVRDLLFGPVTGRDEVPVSLAAARVELATADLVLVNERERVVRELAGLLGVRYWPPLENLGQDFVRGAWSTLRWLTGVQEEPPIPLPLRHADGSTVNAAHIYGAMFRAEPDADPARRAELRRQAAEAAEHSFMLARMIQETVDWNHARD